MKERIERFLDDYVEGDTRYWYPLCILKRDVPVIAFDLDKIYKHGDVAQLERTLKNHRIHLVQMIQLQENGVEAENVDLIELIYEKDKQGYNFPWRVETFYYDSNKDWMIYVSHEGTITFTGKELADEARRTISCQYVWN